MADSRGRFLLGWRAWTLWTIPVLATLYFVWVLLVALGRIKTPTVDLQTWVLAGMGLFGILLLLELLLLLRRREPADEETGAPAEEGTTVIPYAPPPREGGPRIEAEFAATTELWKGMRVLEISLPPKSRNKGGVYAKSYVQVGPESVLRVEDLVADTRDVKVPTSA